MEGKTRKTAIKVIVAMLVISLLATGAIFAAAIASQSEKKDSGQTHASLSQISEQQAMSVPQTLAQGKPIEDDDDEGDVDEDSLTAEELSSLTIDITKERAIEIALGEVKGKVTDVEFERKMGHEVYTVEINDNGDEVDVFIDVKSGNVVGTERDSEEDDDDD